MFAKILFSFSFSLLVSFPFSLSTDHAFYLSLIEIQHTSNASTSSVLVKIFTNDFQDAIHHTFKKEKIQFQEPFYDKNHAFVQTYFSNHLKLKINEKTQSLIFSEGKKIGDQYQLKFDFHCPKSWKSVAIEADFLMEILPLQQNIINLSEGKEKYFGRLKKGNTKISFTF